MMRSKFSRAAQPAARARRSVNGLISMAGSRNVLAPSCVEQTAQAASPGAAGRVTRTPRPCSGSIASGRAQPLEQRRPRPRRAARSASSLAERGGVVRRRCRDRVAQHASSRRAPRPGPRASSGSPSMRACAAIGDWQLPPSRARMRVRRSIAVRVAACIERAKRARDAGVHGRHSMPMTPWPPPAARNARVEARRDARLPAPGAEGRRRRARSRPIRPSSRRRRRVSTLPRSGSMRRSGRAANNCA